MRLTEDQKKAQITVMSEALVEDRNSSGYKKKLYKAQSDQHKAEMLSVDILSKAQALRQSAKENRVSLSDTDDVRQRVDAYLLACAAAATFPSAVGLASFAFGCSRQNVSRWMREHPYHETTAFLEQTFDSFAAILVNAGLYGNAAAPMAIFELKNAHGYRDQVDIAPVQQDNLPPSVDASEIAKRYLSITDREPAIE